MIHNESNLDTMARMPDNSIDSIVTDPPYGLKFMGKKWDCEVPGVETFAEMLRIAKPGAILLCFAGTRTYHRMAVNIEDAGWIIRDMMTWNYGSGFPKSLDISKAIDDLHGAEREVVGNHEHPASSIYSQGQKKLSKHVGITAPSTPDAILWDGWHSNLKPSQEPICIAMKPLDGTFAENALKWGVAGFNIDGGRIAHNEECKMMKAQTTGHDFYKQAGRYKDVLELKPEGRYPSNVILDEYAAELLDEQSGVTSSGVGGGKPGGWQDGYVGGKVANEKTYRIGHNDSGGASRFYYVAKASQSERGMGLDCYRTVKYIVPNKQYGFLSWKDVNTVLAELLKRGTSESITLWNTGESGESITGLCRRDSLSITLTELSKIIESKTYDSLMPSLINEYMAVAKSETGSGGSPAVNAGCSTKSNQDTTNDTTELARGVSRAALQMLLKISGKDAWQEASNIHSTVKPLALMRYLVKLTATPTGGIVYDPFMGSGTTGMACVLEGREFIGSELDPEYTEIARLRIAEAVKQREYETAQQELF